MTVASSNHPHAITPLGKIKQDLVAISGANGDRGPDVELFGNGHWYEQPSFPVEDYFYGYSTVTYQNQLYVFGELYSQSSVFSTKILSIPVCRIGRKANFVRTIFVCCVDELNLDNFIFKKHQEGARELLLIGCWKIKIAKL